MVLILDPVTTSFNCVHRILLPRSQFPHMHVDMMGSGILTALRESKESLQVNEALTKELRVTVSFGGISFWGSHMEDKDSLASCQWSRHYWTMEWFSYWKTWTQPKYKYRWGQTSLYLRGIFQTAHVFLSSFESPGQPHTVIFSLQVIPTFHSALQMKERFFFMSSTEYDGKTCLLI